MDMQSHTSQETMFERSASFSLMGVGISASCTTALPKLHPDF